MTGLYFLFFIGPRPVLCHFLGVNARLFCSDHGKNAAFRVLTDTVNEAYPTDRFIWPNYAGAGVSLREEAPGAGL